MKKILAILSIATFLFYPNVSAFAKSFQGVSYTIIEKSSIGSIKLSINIRLEQKVSKDFLQKLALKLRQDEPKKYDRMFILYYLPGMKPECYLYLAQFDEKMAETIAGVLGLSKDELKCKGCRAEDGQCAHLEMECRVYKCLEYLACGLPKALRLRFPV